MNTIEKLENLAGLQDELHRYEVQKQNLIDSVLTPEIKQKIDDINTEFAVYADPVNKAIATMESEIKTNVIKQGETVKGSVLMAVYAKGRVSWDTKALDGYAAAHPEVGKFRKVGEPSVSIRKVS